MHRPEYAFILPDEVTTGKIGACRHALNALSEEQVDHVFQILSSWRVGQGCYANYFFRMMNKAIKKVRNAP